MSIRAIIHAPAAIAKGILDLASTAIGVYSTGRALHKAPLIGAGVKPAVQELNAGVLKILDNPCLKNNIIPYTNCTIKAFLEGGNGTGEFKASSSSKCFKPNWANFNEFVDSSLYYPLAMIGEKMIADMVFGFHTNLTLTLPLFHIIDDGQRGNDANMLYIASGIAAIDVVYGLTLPSESTPEHN